MSPAEGAGPLEREPMTEGVLLQGGGAGPSGWLSLRKSGRQAAQRGVAA